MVDNEGGDNEVMPSWRASQSVISREDSKAIKYQLRAFLFGPADLSTAQPAKEDMYVTRLCIFLQASLREQYN